MGRKSKPNIVKLLENNPGGRPLPEEIKLEGEAGSAPEWFNEDQREAWDDITAAAPPDLLKAADRNLLVIYCQAVGEHKEASLRLEAEGYIVEAVRGGTKRNDWVAVKNRAAEIMLKAGSEMGFTPASRSKVVSQGKGKTNRFKTNGRRSGT